MGIDTVNELERLGRVAAQGLVGDKAVEDVQVVVGEDSLDRQAYFFSFLIDERVSGEQAGLRYIRLIQRLRDALIAQGDSHYPIIKILNRDEWKNARLPDPVELISTARFLSDAEQSQLTDARLRRAVSTAYYALFHKVLRTAAERFLGPGQQASPGYALLYRSFDHHHMRTTCEHLNVSTLGARLQRQLRRTMVSQDLRDFAGAFSALQEARHLADYDPNAVFDPTDVFDLVNAAELAMIAFDRVEPAEQTDVLALMMVKTRG